MGEDLTPRQREILEAIKRSLAERGYPPSVREIGREVGLRSTSTVHGHLKRLRSKGLITWDPARPRTIGMPKTAGMTGQPTVTVPLVGYVRAGEPILAVENIEAHVPLPWDWVRSENAFILRVKGDSMIDAGIFHGDYVLVRKQDHAENGEIVVAMTGDEATVKRFYLEKDRIRLQPENRTMEPIFVHEAKILGVVVGLFRKIK